MFKNILFGLFIFQQSFSHAMTVFDCGWGLNAHFWSAPSLKYLARDTCHDIPTDRIILTPGWHVLIPRSSFCNGEFQAIEQLVRPFVFGIEPTHPGHKTDALRIEPLCLSEPSLRLRSRHAVVKITMAFYIIDLVLDIIKLNSNVQNFGSISTKLEFN